MPRVEVASKVRAYTDIQIANTAATYAAGRQIGSLITISGALRTVNRTGVLVTLAVVDAQLVSPPLTLMFFRSAPTITSTNNTTVAISAAEMNTKFIGFVDVGTTDWMRLSAVGAASVTNIGLNIDSTDAASQSLYVLVVAAGAFTYSSTNQLKMSLTIIQD